jgi:predicted alpha/beta-fold hydrolase
MHDDFSWFRPSRFSPHPLLTSGHAQTLCAGFGLSKRVPCSSRQHTIPTTDGDQLALHENLPAQWRDGDLCSLLVHGLGGSHRSPYLVRITNKLEALGVRVYRLDMRGCGAGYRLAQRTAHAGRSEDVAAAIEFISAQSPNSPIVLSGFSLGANQVLKLLGEWGKGAPSSLLRALAIAPPIDLQTCSRNLARLSRYPYNRWFVRSLVRDARRRAAWVPALDALDWQRPPRSLYEFDDLVTAPINDFSGADQYYAHSSSLPWLEQIRRPTMILAAQDDPIVPATIFHDLNASNRVALHMTKRGGHLGYIGRRGPDPDRNWLEWRVVEFVMGPRD